MKIKAYELRKFGPEGSKPLDPGPNVDSRGSDLSFFEDAKQDFQQMNEGFGEDVKRRRQNVQEIGEATASGEQSTAEGVFQNVGEVVGTAGDALMRGISAIGKAITPQKQEEQVSEAVKPILESISNSETVQEATEKWQKFAEENPRAARNLGAAFNIGEVATEVGGGALLGKVLNRGIRGGAKVVRDSAGKVKDILPDRRNIQTVEGVFTQADMNLKQLAPNERRELLPDGDKELIDARIAAEESLPTQTFQQKYINMEPSMQRVYEEAGKDKVADYLNITVTANADLKGPQNVMRFAGDKAREQVDVIQKKLDDPGTEIGQTRRKLANIEAPIDEIRKIENNFRNELEKINLTIKSGDVVPKRNAPTASIKQGDINALNALYKDILVAKESPKLKNLVDLRIQFDDRIKFDKRAQEVTNNVDGVARKVRGDIAETMEKVVGKDQAANVKEYSEVMKVLNELRSWTDRRAGGEYIMGSVVSSRGGEIDDVLRKVKEMTGYDLKEDALIVNDLVDRFGNFTQRSRFRNQIKDAGVDVAKDAFGAARGEPGALLNLGRQAVDRFIDEEDVIRQTSRTNANSTPPTDLPGDNTPGGSATKAPDGGGTPTN